MGKIVAIGGGEISKGKTLIIDKFIVSLANKKTPNFLFIPTASNDAVGYIELVKKHFTGLNCSFDSLCLVSKNLSNEEIKQKILSADIIYVGGGNTLEMMKVWKENNVDKYLKLAFDKGTVLSGLSAGSICWFSFGHSDSLSFEDEDNFNFIKVNGLNFLNFAHCPHYNEQDRDSFDEMLIGENITGVALEDNTALAFIDGKYSIIKSNDEYKAYAIYNNGEKQIKRELMAGEVEL